MPDATGQSPRQRRPKTGQRTEYRLCGERGSYGDWSGSWRVTEPTESEIKRLLKRNSKVRLERREVTETPPEIVVEYVGSGGVR